MREEIDYGHVYGSVTVTAETDKALQIDGEFWVPKSQRHDDSEVWGLGDEGELVVKTWFAKQRGWV